MMRPRPSIFGGSWIDGSNAGSRYANLDNWPENSNDNLGARGRSDDGMPWLSRSGKPGLDGVQGRVSSRVDGLGEPKRYWLMWLDAKLEPTSGLFDEKTLLAANPLAFVAEPVKPAAKRRRGKR